jgi:hypothetical protein
MDAPFWLPNAMLANLSIDKGKLCFVQEKNSTNLDESRGRPCGFQVSD